MKSYQQFFAELTRRRVFKVAAVYGATAFVLLQVADLLQEALALPSTFLPFIMAATVLGFPLALVLAWAFEMSPQGMRRTDQAAPGEIERIIAAPASKRWPAGLLGLLGLGALLAGVWFAGQSSGRASLAEGEPASESDGASEVRLAYPDDDRPSIAVLPFEDMSPEGDQEYFSDGMTEEILNVLAKIPELRVTARTSAFAFKGRQVDLRAVGDSLGVSYLVEGSVRKAGDELRITAQLIDAADGSHVWSESYDRKLDNVFAIQSEIAEAVAARLRVPLGIEVGSALVTPTADIAAYDLYLAGRGRLRERGTSLGEAIRLFEAAIARDSTWAPAWAGLAEANELISWYPFAWEGGLPADDSTRVAIFLSHQAAAERAAERALELKPDIASARVALGSIHRNRFEWQRSEEEYRRALSVDPDNPEAHQQYSEMLLTTGRLAEGLLAAERALALDRAPVRLLQYANGLLAQGRRAEAIAALDEGISLDPDNEVTGLRMNRFWLQMEAGNYDAMYDHVDDFRAVDLPLAAERQRIVAALVAGDAAGYPRDWIDPTAWMIFGEPDSAAVDLLRDVEANPYQNWNWIWDPFFDGLRDRPAYLEVLGRLNLEGVTVQRETRDVAGDDS